MLRLAVGESMISCYGHHNKKQVFMTSKYGFASNIGVSTRPSYLVQDIPYEGATLILFYELEDLLLFIYSTTILFADV